MDKPSPPRIGKPGSLKHRLTATFCLLAALLLVLGWHGVRRLRQLDQETQGSIYSRWSEEQMVQEAFRLSDLKIRTILSIFLVDDQEEGKRLRAQSDMYSTRITELLRSIEPRLGTAEERRLLGAVEAARKLYIESYQLALAKLLDERQREEARRLVVEVVLPRIAVYHAAWNAFSQCQTEKIQQTVQQSNADFATAQQGLLGLIILAVLLTSATAYYVTSRVQREITEREHAQKALRHSHDDLEQRVQERTAELGKSNASLLAEMGERVQANTAMLAAEEKYRGIFENSISGIFLTSPDGRYLNVNPSLARIYGYGSIGELMTCLSDIARDLYVDPHRRADFIRIMEKDGRVKDFESQIYRKDKSVIWISESARAMRDPQGKITHYEGVVDDVTERKQGEESLQLLRSAVEQSRESIMITDALLDLPGPRILFVNPAFTKMTGYTAKEAIGKTPRILQGPRTDKKVLSRLRQNLAQGLEFEGEAINYRKDGKEFDLEWQIAPIRNSSGTTTHFVAIQRDITARKRMETQMTQSQKMETVGKLAGGIAHEFNSIMTAIIGQSELMLADLPPRDPLLKNAREIRTAADRAATLTRQLLAYGRKQILLPEVLDLNAVLAGMETMLRHLLGKNSDVCIVPAVGLKAVKADAGQIEQVIVNIAMNAAEAMPNGGKLTLETANVTLGPEYVSQFPGLKAGEYVLLAITDTGVGMKDEVKARIFEPFFSTKDVGQGTGLGLATCYGILKQSGGHISLYTEPARGATFKIYLPQVEALPELPAARLDTPDLPRGTETILLAEDDPALREMAATLLRRLGYTVLTAANGLEALNLKQQRGIGHVDLLFTDVVMPNMGGKELSDRIQTLYPQTRVLFTSAYTQGAIVHQGVLEAGVALLQKPFTPGALARKVREVLNQPLARPPVTEPENLDMVKPMMG